MSKAECLKNLDLEKKKSFMNVQNKEKTDTVDNIEKVNNVFCNFLII